MLTLKSEDKDEGPDQEMSAEALSKLASLAGAQGVKAALKRASDATGVGFDLLYNMARRESSLDPGAKAKTSSAAGLFQFIEETWLGAVKTYGARHGLAAEAAAITRNAAGKFVVADAARREGILNLRFDPMKAAALAGELVEENRAGLERRLGRAVDAAEVYAAHFFGLGGAAKLLAAAPDAIAADILPKAAAANRAVFYEGARARTIGEVIAAMATSMGVAAPTADTMRPAASIAAPAPASENSKAAPARLSKLASTAKASAVIPADIEKKSADLMLASIAGGMSALKPLLSPLALAALQAIDPARLGAEKREADTGDR
jgi:hypothetical protein